MHTLILKMNTTKPTCKYGDECKISQDVKKDSMTTVLDKCHMKIYRHPQEQAAGS